MTELDFDETNLAVYYVDYCFHCKDYKFRNRDYFDFEFYKRETPERAKPFPSILSPITKISMADTVSMIRLYFRFSLLEIKPNPNISGTVLRLKASIEKAPCRMLPVESA